MLQSSYTNDGQTIEAGIDEAGRGPLAGPVVAAAVILPPDFKDELLNDSKKLTAKQRDKLRIKIEQEALAWSVCFVDNNEIDEVNILQATYNAMHRAVDGLKTKPDLLLVDGNRFRPYEGIPHKTIVKGDATYMSIAAASILAKTHRDEYMLKQAETYPQYGWAKNMGYPTKAHREAILQYGYTPLHRLTFTVQTSAEKAPVKNRKKKTDIRK